MLYCFTEFFVKNVYFERFKLNYFAWNSKTMIASEFSETPHLRF